ncbi:MAG: hypothetical protein WD696_11975 [Bryobacteraceae bacterium]
MSGSFELPAIVLSGDIRDVSDWLQSASDWYAEISRGQCRLSWQLMGPLTLPKPTAWYAAGGGMGPLPRNSQALVADAIEALGPSFRASRLLVVGEKIWLPHAWHLPGTHPCRYAVLSGHANLGTVVHELGHLLFEWPDFQWPWRWGRECLMALGATGELGADPSPPSAPLLLRQGWRETAPMTRALKVQDLAGGDIATMDWDHWQVLAEWRRDRGASRLMMYARPADSPHSTPHHPKARVLLSEDEAQHSVLGLLAPHLRRLGGGGD